MVEEPEVEEPVAEEPEVEEPVADEETIAVEVRATPAGEVYVDGEARGTAPTSVDLPVGRAVTVEVRAEGYAAASQEVTAEEGIEPLAFTLERMPWVVSIVTEPAGARVTLGGESVTAPGELRFDEWPRDLEATATRAGYVSASETISASDFSVSEGAQRATVRLTLEERVARSATPMRAPRMTAMMAEATATMEPEPTMEPAPTMEAAPTAMEEAPPPAMEEAPTMEAVPDNPF